MKKRLDLGLGLVLALLAAGCGVGGNEIPALPPGSFVAASGSFAPDTHLFGDFVTARVEVVVDHRRLDPARVRLEAAFKPYEQVGEPAVDRRDAGDLTALRYRVRLRCLDYGCITATLGTIVDPSGGAPQAFRFPPAQVLYEQPGSKQPRPLRSVRWPVLQSVSRINGQDVTQVYGFPFRSTVTPLPALTYRISPPRLAAVLLAAAVALLALPAVLIVRRVRRRKPPPAEAAPELSPLARAILLVEWSRERADGAERREALEALAAELDTLGSAPLAHETRRAAWSPPSPSPREADRIVSIVREQHGSG